ncbi:MAG: recombinase family protein [Caulobacter sp.]
MRVAVYARYSSERQNERSIEDQIAVCTRHAAGRGWTVTITFQDAAISGQAMANRPGLLYMLARAEAGDFDLVLVEDEDRLARNLEHLAHIASRLEQAGVQLATLSTDRVEDLHVAFKGLQASLYIKNLSQKTKRGMASNAEKGLATGSRLYGYASTPGGDMTIVPAEAETVRRIFAGYAGGLTTRDIASSLNEDRVPGPRGGYWNASTLQGSASRGNGILRTELYAGVKVWNRMDVRKDPRTGKRTPRLKPVAEWRRTEVPHLAIIDAETWSKVQDRLGQSAGRRPETFVRRPHLLSGLFKCAHCGGTYTVYRRGGLMCAAAREKGPSVCGNRRVVERRALEARVLEGLKARLLAPEHVAAFVRAYHDEWQRQAAEDRASRHPLERRLAELSRRIDRVIDAVCDGTATKAMTDRLQSMEDERDALAADLERLDQEQGAPPVTLHPRAAERYAALVADLQDALARGEDMPEAVTAVRALIERIDVMPTDGEPRLTLHGDLARFLSPQDESEWRGTLVAGGGIEPPTCGL